MMPDNIWHFNLPANPGPDMNVLLYIDVLVRTILGMSRVWTVNN